MDFDSRNFLWDAIQSGQTKGDLQNHELCKVCAGLEILKLSVCAGDCNSCEDNFFSTFLDIFPEDQVKKHLDRVKKSIEVHSKVEEIEKKVPMYFEKQDLMIRNLELKIEDLLKLAEKLNTENKALQNKIKIIEKQYNELESTKGLVTNELNQVKSAQSDLMKTIQDYFHDSKLIWESILQYFDYEKIESRLSTIDDTVLCEVSQIEKISDYIKSLNEKQQHLESEQFRIKEDLRHCERLEKASEKILEFNRDLIELNTSIEDRLKEIDGSLSSRKNIEKANEDYRSKVLELRKKTSECLLKPS